MIKYIVFIFLLLQSYRVLAHQPTDGDVHITFGPFYYYTPPISHYFDSPISASPGLLAEADVNKHGGLEVSFFYMDTIYSLNREQLTVTEQVKRIYIATGYRHWFHRKLAVAAAFASAYALGDPEVLGDEYPVGFRPKTSARDTVEYLIDLSIQHEIWSEGRYAFLIDGRVGYSLTPKDGEDANIFGVFLGLKYHLQSRGPRKNED